MQKKILGIDPGSRVTGYGIIESEGQSYNLVVCGVVRTDQEKNFSMRLKKIYESLSFVIHKYWPTEVACESLFFAKNVSSALKLGQARGAALTAVANEGLPLFEYSATQIKKAVGGYGHSSKEQVQKMVSLLLGVNLQKASIPLDATDALSIAICHLHSHKLLALMPSRRSDDRASTR